VGKAQVESGDSKGHKFLEVRPKEGREEGEDEAPRGGGGGVAGVGGDLGRVEGCGVGGGEAAVSAGPRGNGCKRGGNCGRGGPGWRGF